MALDIHLVRRGNRFPETGSYTGFGVRDEHEIYQLVVHSAAEYPQVAKMQDYQDDVFYEGQDLKDLAAELEKVLPKFSEGSIARTSLSRLRDFSVQAVNEDKTLMLFAD